MRICLIVNENAGSADQAEELDAAVEEAEDVVQWKSVRKGHAVTLAQRAADDGFDVVAAAGGDGTMNEVVNGVMRSSERPALGIVPLGTGNDLARMLEVPPKDPGDALKLLSEGERRRMDLFLMETKTERWYGINAATGGFSGQVDEALTAELKANWGPLAYLIGAASVIPEIRDYDTYLALDDGAPEIVSAMNIIVANGRTLAGGKRVSPLSNPEDGLLDVVVIRRGSVVEIGDVATRLVAGNLFASKLVTHRRASRVKIESEPGMWFNLDGELLTEEPIVISVRPGAINVVVGPDYVSEPEE